ncbi:MAG: lipid-A-disaccharide synthase [Magnetococcus sp. WYHC-3]
MKQIFLIAGEASGDTLGASLMRGLKNQGVPAANMVGIGGALMAEEGLESLLPMDELCVMGLWEVVGQLPRLLKLINAMVEEIENRQPDILVTIDLPDFNFQVAKRLKKRGVFKGKIIHYVAPSVWAWRPGRAKKIAAYLDGLMCLFPFEPKYFEKHGLKAAYVGHPLIELDKSAIDRTGFRENTLGIAPDTLCIGAFFGSREGEVATHMPLFLQGLDALHEQQPGFEVIAPTLPALEHEVRDALAGMPFTSHVITDPRHKWNAFASCDAALAVSGTVGLELAYLGVPHLIGYRAHPLTALIVRLLIKTKFVHLGNIMLQEAVVPEYLQGKCTAQNLLLGLLRLIRQKETQAKQQEGFARLAQTLKIEDAQTPSARAAAFVLSLF